MGWKPSFQNGFIYSCRGSAWPHWASCMRTLPFGSQYHLTIPNPSLARYNGDEIYG